MSGSPPGRGAVTALLLNRPRHELCRQKQRDRKAQGEPTGRAETFAWQQSQAFP